MHPVLRYTAVSLDERLRMYAGEDGKHMVKQGKTRDPENTARRKLADAQAKLHSAQERRTRAVSAGDVELEKTRQKLDKQIDKTTKLVESRAAKVARAEARLLSVQRRQAKAQHAAKAVKPAKTKKGKASSGTVTDTPEAVSDQLEAMMSEPAVCNAPEPEASGNEDMSPDGAADHLAAIVEMVAEAHADDPILRSDAPGAEGAGRDIASLDQYEQRLLIVLRDDFGATGATYSDWLAVAGMSKRTFLRARKALADAGIVERRGTGQGARYFAGTTA